MPYAYDVGAPGGYVAEISGAYFSFRILDGEESVAYTYPVALRIYTIDLPDVIFTACPAARVSQPPGVRARV